MSASRRSCALGVGAHGARAERRDEALDEGDAFRRARFGRREEPRRRVEEVGGRASRTAGGAAGDGMTRDEARVVDRRERALRRGDVGDDRVRRRGIEHLLHDRRSGADRHRDDDELGVRDRLGERRRRLHAPSAAARSSTPESGIEAAAARPSARRGERDRRPDQPGADDREALDCARPVGDAAGADRSAPLGRHLLLEHVEHGGEDRPHAALRQRPAIRGDERLQQLRLALGVDPPLARGVLEVAHRSNELEPPVERLEESPVELVDLVAEGVEVAHAAYRSPASTATASRFAGGASGQTQPGSYEHDGL